MTTGIEKHTHKHMGCMASFLHIFNRRHTGKRIHSPKRLSHPSQHTISPEPASEVVSSEPKAASVPTLPTTKFSRETSRLSLDSRTIVDAKGTLHLHPRRRSTSVIARLMGLEPLPDPEPGPVANLQSSVSGPLPLTQCRFFDPNKAATNVVHENNINNAAIDSRLVNTTDRVATDPPKQRVKKSCYDSSDFFPEPKHTVLVYGEIERRLRMHGINVALQLKGRLHSKYNIPSQSSPTVVMKPVRSANRTGNHSPRSSPRRSVKNGRSPNRRKQLKAEPQRRVGVDSRRVSPVHSPRRNANATGQHVPPRMMRKNIVRKISSTISDNSFGTCSYPDTERCRLEGKDLLDRCNKLLRSIAEITVGNNELQSSPVSVLDSSLYKDDDCSPPSPIAKAAESEDDMWSAASGDCDFAYVSEILRACTYLPDESDIFLLLEKQQCLKGKDTSKASTLQRRLIFDTLQEILNRNQQELPPWKAVSRGGQQRRQIWSEFRRIREREESESDLFKVICGVVKKDIADEMHGGWGEWPVEMGDVVLDIERLVFKDLVDETIRELASFSPHCCNMLLPARFFGKLVF